MNRTFVSDVLGGGNAIGRRVRHVDVDNADPTRPWYEIVGVVGDLPANPVTPEAVQACVYHPMPHGRDYGSKLAVRLRTGDTDRFAGRLREMTLALDPTLRLTSLMPLAESYRRTQMVAHWLALALVIVTLSVLLLSAAGMYALLSFTVTRRRREIGIRVALGADARRILRSVFFRAAIQLGLGVVLGSIAAVLLDIGSEGDLMGGRAALLLPVVSAVMMAVGLLAAFGPARRGLRVNPTEALRAE